MHSNTPSPTAPITLAPAPPRHPVGARIAGLPTTALDASRIPLSTELALDIALLDQRLLLEAQQLSDALYGVIGAERARPFKAKLVGLRRAVHQGARIGSLIDAAAPPGILGEALTARLRAHAALRHTRDERFAELERVLPAETRTAARALRTLVRDPEFATGLDYASPDLYEDLLRWAAHDTAGRRPLDGAAVRLAKYAGRAMAKPTPLTTFAASGRGRWAAGAGPAVDLRSTARKRTHPAEVALLPLSRIAAALAHVPELGHAVQLRVNPTATPERSAEGERWLFTVPGPSGAVRTLPATGALNAILRAVAEAGSPQRLRELLGAGGPGSTADAVITRLVRLGLLEVRIGLPDQDLDAAALCAWLGRHLPRPRTKDRLSLLLDDLRAVRDQIEAARTADAGSHRAITAGLRRHLTKAAQRLELLGPTEQLEQSPLYFSHTVADGTAVALDPDAWRPALADLALVPALLTPFDTLAPPRAALRQQAVSVYGPGFTRSFTRFLQDFGGWWEAAGSHPLTGRDARRQDALRQLIATTAPAPDGTIRLAPDEVRDLCGAWPEPDTSGDTHTCYVQTLPGSPSGLGLVLNTVTCGHGTGLTRITRLLGEPAGDTHIDGMSEGPASRPRPVEFDAVFASALNQRAPATRYAIDLDGSTSHRPPERLIRPGDLDVVHDPRTRRLRLVHRATGRVIRPLHLGLLATPLLPAQARLLVEAFGQTSYAFWADWPQLWRLLPSEHTGAAPGWSAMPRLALGAVVLRRATWFIDAGGAPARAPGESDAAYLVRVHTWRAALGLPRRCFLRSLTARPADGFTGPALRDKDRKPVYLDFAHAHLLRVFERAAATGRPLLLTEALPDLHDAPAHQDGRRHVTEFVIEVPSAAHGRERTC
ncbi:lantibiotic dehydratase [Streptomyces sp. NPDC006660]|uniref:lantibiotic dehydratase n=1 Tax=Streptomyces sp. NPDC006660 TaxID=3156901 RepID=UPI0033DA826F